VEELEKMGETPWVEWTEGILAKRRYVRGRLARDVPLRGDDAAGVNFLEAWERNSAGKQVSHNSWVRDLEFEAEAMWGGRSGRLRTSNSTCRRTAVKYLRESFAA
jgi:hypothetical protein